MQIQIDGKEKYDKYILVAPGSDYGKAMWEDINKIDNGCVLDKVIASDNKFINILHHIHFSFAINSRIKLPFQGIWKRTYSLNKIIFNENEQYCVIYTDISAGRTDRKYLEKLHNKKNVKVVLVMVNTMRHRKKVLDDKFKYFDRIFSFDMDDCRKYDFIYHPTNYSILNINQDVDILYDAFFVGVSKGRQEELEKIFEWLKVAGANSSFYISGVEKKNNPDIYYNQWLSYQEVLQHIEKSNCIVEVMENNQSGVTLRTMEAICYNKKLLTNNQSVKKLPFYKTGYIQVFEKLSDIDPEFVLDRKPVDYHYQGEFSPIHLLEHINELSK